MGAFKIRLILKQIKQDSDCRSTKKAGSEQKKSNQDAGFIFLHHGELWKKADSTFEPDYCAQRLNDNPWIVKPFEKYEEIRIEDLKKLHS